MTKKQTTPVLLANQLNRLTIPSKHENVYILQAGYDDSGRLSLSVLTRVVSPDGVRVELRLPLRLSRDKQQIPILMVDFAFSGSLNTSARQFTIDLDPTSSVKSRWWIGDNVKAFFTRVHPTADDVLKALSELLALRASHVPTSIADVLADTSAHAELISLKKKTVWSEWIKKVVHTEWPENTAVPHGYVILQLTAEAAAKTDDELMEGFIATKTFPGCYEITREVDGDDEIPAGSHLITVYWDGIGPSLPVSEE